MDVDEDDHRCIICCNAEAGCMLSPCGHDSFCAQCVAKLDKCPLCCAAVQRSPLEELQRVQCEGLQIVKPDGRTALHLAAIQGDVALVKRYLESGVSVDVLTRHQLAPLHYAIIEGHVDVAVSLLAAKAAVNTRDASSSTPLHLAANYGRTTLADILLAENADVSAVDLQEMTPLHWAARMSHERVALALLSARADLNARSCHGAGYTPLAVAEDWGTASMTCFLRDKGGYR